MKVVVGLGNPGEKYLLTRHNLGFMLIDALLTADNAFQNKHKSWICKTSIRKQPILLVKPKTFMNLSGQALKDIVSFYKIPLDEVLVIHDDKDQAFGKIKFQKSRGHGGHNGVKNIHQELKSKDYCRLKMGIAPPVRSSVEENSSAPYPSQTNLFSRFFKTKVLKHKESIPSSVLFSQDTSQFVLSPFDSKEQERLPKFLQLGIEAVSCFIEQGYVIASNKFNSREKV